MQPIEALYLRHLTKDTLKIQDELFVCDGKVTLEIPTTPELFNISISQISNALNYYDLADCFITASCKIDISRCPDVYIEPEGIRFDELGDRIPYHRLEPQYAARFNEKIEYVKMVLIEKHRQLQEDLELTARKFDEN